MRDLVRLFSQIALLRKGPQDVPASAWLLAATALGYFAVNFAVSLVLPPIDGPWFAQLVVDTLFTLAWYAVLLRILGKRERFPQTVTAVLGYRAVLSPFWIAAIWLSRRFGEDPLWQFPVALAGLMLAIWMVAAGSHVLKAALEWSWPAAVILVLLEIFTLQLLLITMLPGEG